MTIGKTHPRLKDVVVISHFFRLGSLLVDMKSFKDLSKSSQCV